MFDQTFVLRERNARGPVSVLLSICVQTSLIVAAIWVSIASTQLLPVYQLKSMLLAPRPPLTAARAGVKNADRNVLRSMPRLLTLNFSKVMAVTKAQAPAAIATAPTIAGAEESSAGDAGVGAILNGVPGPASAPPPRHETHAASSSGPVRVGGNVAAANLVHQVMPIYPRLATTAHVQGTVVFTAVIGKDGAVKNLQVVHGHPLLITAAEQAVMQWRYRPTLLNGAPVEVATEITVHFTLGQ